MKMTEKQRRFADEYIKTGHITKSAINAGYSEKTANSIGRENLEKPRIKAYIDKHMEENKLDEILSQQEALILLKQMAFGEVTDKQPMFVGEGVQEMVEVPAPTNVRLRAIESMLKRYDVAGRDLLLNRKLELEIKKMEKELESVETTEDKMSEFLDKMDKLVENDDN